MHNISSRQSYFPSCPIILKILFWSGQLCAYFQNDCIWLIWSTWIMCMLWCYGGTGCCKVLVQGGFRSTNNICQRVSLKKKPSVINYIGLSAYDNIWKHLYQICTYCGEQRCSLMPVRSTVLTVQWVTVAWDSSRHFWMHKQNSRTPLQSHFTICQFHACGPPRNLLSLSVRSAS